MRIDPHKYRHIFRNIRADRTDDLQRESAAIFQASAVLVGSMIDSAG